MAAAVPCHKTTHELRSHYYYRVKACTAGLLFRMEYFAKKESAEMRGIYRCSGRIKRVKTAPQLYYPLVRRYAAGLYLRLRS